MITQFITELFEAVPLGMWVVLVFAIIAVIIDWAGMRP